MGYHGTAEYSQEEKRAAFTPFNDDKDFGKEDVVLVCSGASDNDAAAQEIDEWAQAHGYARSGEQWLNVRRNLSGEMYYYSACFPIGGGDSDGEHQSIATTAGRYDKTAPAEASATLMRESTAQRGTQIYEQKIRPLVKAENFGRYVAIDVRTGDYEVGDDHLTTVERLQDRRRGAIVYTVRVGYRAVARVGVRTGMHAR